MYCYFLIVQCIYEKSWVNLGITATKDILTDFERFGCLSKYSKSQTKSANGKCCFQGVFDNTTTLSHLCVTRWTVRETTFKKVLTNYSQLMELWEICLRENLERETRSHIIGCQDQMKLFKLFYSMHLSYKLSSTIIYQKLLKRSKICALMSQPICFMKVY